LDRVACWLAVAAVGLVPLLVTPSAYDPYRLPKAMLVRAIGIAIVAVVAMRIVSAGVPRLEWRKDAFLRFSALAVAWTAVCAVFSRNRLISAWSLMDVVSYAAIVFAVYAFGRRRWRAAVQVMLAAAVLNALSCILARFGDGGFAFATLQGRSVGLLGSANDAGAYFAIVIVVAVAMAVADRKQRWTYAVVAAFLIAGLATTQTLGAIAATIAAGLAMTFLVSRRRAVLFCGILLAGALGILVVYAPLRARAVGMVRGARSGNIDAIFPGRATAFLSALEMVKDRPLTGVGPGCFGFEYFPYKLRVELDHPSLMMSDSRTINFGEAHNDHLQTLAQTGVPGYLLFIAALVWLARISVQGAGAEMPERFSRFAAFPLVVCFAVVTLPEFVLELAAPTTCALTAASLCCLFRGGHADT
jgi:O-antigen ligase